MILLERFSRENSIPLGFSVAAPGYFIPGAYSCCDPAPTFLIVGGIQNGAIPLGIANRYEIDSWTAVSQVPSPNRSQYVAVGDQYRTAAIGGLAIVVPFYSTQVDVMSLSVWTSETALPIAKYSHCGCTIGNSEIVFGGRGIDQSVSNQGFELSNHTWQSIAAQPLPWRFFSTAEATSIGALIVGGITNHGVPTAASVLYSKTSDDWSTAASVPLSSLFGAGSFRIAETVHVVGGNQAGIQLMNTNLQWTNDTWQFQPPFPSGASYHAVGGGSQGVGFYTGGIGPGNIPLRTHQSYSNNTWAIRSILPDPPRWLHAGNGH